MSLDDKRKLCGEDIGRVGRVWGMDKGKRENSLVEKVF
jgi:hypothetical protein